MRYYNPLRRYGSKAQFKHTRLASPKLFAKRSFRTISPREDVRVIIGCPKGHYSGGRCRVGTRAQAILHRKNPAMFPGSPQNYQPYIDALHQASHEVLRELHGHADIISLAFDQNEMAIYDDLLHYVKSEGRLRQLDRGWRENPYPGSDYQEALEEVAHELISEFNSGAESLSDEHAIPYQLALRDLKTVVLTSL